MKRLGVGVFLVLVAGALAFFFLREERGLLRHDTREGVRHFTEESEFYRISAHYPDGTSLAKSAGRGADREATKRMEQFIAEEVARFKHDGGFATLSEEDKEILGFREGRRYELSIRYTTHKSPGTVSFVFTIYHDTGGAPRTAGTGRSSSMWQPEQSFSCPTCFFPGAIISQSYRKRHTATWYGL